MNLDVTFIKDKSLNEPMVLFPLRQYEKLMEYLEDIEDRLAIIERADEPDIPSEEVEKKFKKKFLKK